MVASERARTAALRAGAGTVGDVIWNSLIGVDAMSMATRAAPGIEAACAMASMLSWPRSSTKPPIPHIMGGGGSSV
jgi:hypothetical protein